MNSVPLPTLHPGGIGRYSLFQERGVITVAADVANLSFEFEIFFFLQLPF